MSAKFNLLPVMVIAVLLAGTAQGQDLLRWQFEEGDHYKVMAQRMQRLVYDRDDDSRPEVLTLNFDWLVTDVGHDGAATLEIRIERIRMEDDAGDVFYEYDTDDETSFTGRWAERKDFIIGIIDQPLVIVLSERGELLNFSIPEESQEAFAAGPGPRDIRSFRSQFFSAWPVLPEDAVAEGDTWQAEVDLDEGHILTYGAQFTHRGESQSEGKPVMRLEVTYDFQPVAGEGLKELTEAEGNGDLYFDTTAGHLLSFSTEGSYWTNWENDLHEMSGTEFRYLWKVTPAEE